MVYDIWAESVICGYLFIYNVPSCGCQGLDNLSILYVCPAIFQIILGHVLF